MKFPLPPFADSDADLLAQVRAALRCTGDLLPITDEEVEQALNHIESRDEDPAATSQQSELSDPYELFRSGRANPSSGSSAPMRLVKEPGEESTNARDDVSQPTMAIAAREREGDEIPTEIREKMARDRSEAEQEQNDEN